MTTRDILYLDGNLIDLPEGFFFTITVQKLEIQDITGRNVNYTNSVKIRWTPRNELALGFLRNEKVTGASAYKKMTARLIQAGTETIPDGLAIITAIDQQGATVSIYENSYSIFSSLVGRKIVELNYLAPGGWNAANIDAARLNTSGILTAIVEYGFPGNVYQFNYFLPSTFYGELVQKILKSTGLTLSGAILTDTDLTDLIIPFAKDKWEYDRGYGEPYTFNVLVGSYPLPGSGGYQIAGVLGGERLKIDTDTDLGFPTFWTGSQGSRRIWNTTTYEATVPNDAPGKFLVMDINVNFGFQVITWGGGGTDTFDVELHAIISGVDTIISTLTIDEITYGTVAWTIAMPAATATALSGGDKIYVKLANPSTAGVPTNLIINGQTSGTKIIATAPLVVDRANVIFNQLQPDVYMLDVLRDFTVRFGILYKQIGNTLYLKTIEEIINDTAGAINWESKRRNKEKDQIIPRASGYAQVNEFKYTANVTAGEESWGSGFIRIANTALESSRIIFTSIFENSIDGFFQAAFTIAYVWVYTTGATGISDFNKQAPGLRVLRLRAKRATEPTITFNGVARSDYKCAHFADTAEAKTAAMDYYIGKYYKGLTRSLQAAKTVTHYYELTPADIAGYDPFKMIYDDNAYYLIVKISNFIPGRVTKVELLKIE